MTEVGMMFFSRKVLLSPFALWLAVLHTVCNLSTCVEYWADDLPFGHMLWRLPVGFLFIFCILFLFTLAGYALAKTKVLAK